MNPSEEYFVRERALGQMRNININIMSMEKQVNPNLEVLTNITDGNMTVCELVDRYLKTKTGVRQSTKQGYVTVRRVPAKESFGKKEIRSVTTSDAKLSLI